MPTIILSYRREDTAWIAGRIHDRLREHYGTEHVFMDIDSIPFGLDFREHIQDSLERCDILLAIIGPRWVGPVGTAQPRIHDEADWVRIEIEAALAKKIPVIPVLIDGARLPPASDLPGGMRDIVFRQAADVDAGRDFHPHMDRLIGVMDKLLARKDPAPAVEPEPTERAEEKTPRKDEPAKSKKTPRKQAPVQAETKTLKAASVSATTEAAAGKFSWRETVWPLLTSLQGRLPRQSFAIALAASFVAMLALVLAVGLPYNEFTGRDGTPPIVLVFPLAWTWIAVALGAKRLHDLNWPVWPVAVPLVLGLFVPTFIGLASDLWPRLFFGASAALAFLLLSPTGWMRGTEGPNRFGPDPIDQAKTDAAL